VAADASLDGFDARQVFLQARGVGLPELRAERAGLLEDGVDDLLVGGVGLGRLGGGGPAGAGGPVGDDGGAALEEAVEDLARLVLVGDELLGSAPGVAGLVVGVAELEGGQPGRAARELRGGLVDGDPGVGLAVALPGRRGAREVQVAAVLVAVQVLGLAAVAEAGEDEDVVLVGLEGAEDRRQLAERPRLLRLPRFEDRAARDRVDREAERGAADCAGASDSRKGSATAAPAPLRMVRRLSFIPTSPFSS
jgi:hypothetical protein